MEAFADSSKTWKEMLSSTSVNVSDRILLSVVRHFLFSNRPTFSFNLKCKHRYVMAK